ncbi:MAG TPA: endonuclease III [Actinomycetota bacterium]
MSWQPPDPKLVREAHRRLARRLGPLAPPTRRDPVEELVLTVLSQNTSDVNRDRAFAALRERFPTWEALAGASPDDVAEAIRPGGLSRIKAPRILAILREIRDRDGELDLEWMRDAPDDEIGAYLRTLPGVGPKTAACVLAFSLERPVIPVDTHVHRVAGRLGWIPPGTGADRAHDVLADVVPPRLRVSMHVGLIRLGREICKPGRPRCEDCPLNDLCPTAPRFLAGAPRERRSSSARP